MAKIPKKKWSVEEVDYLTGLAGDYPLPELTKRYNRKGKAMGWPYRTARAIQLKLHRMQISLKTIDDYFPKIKLAKLLKVQRGTIAKWVKDGLLPADCYGSIKKIDFARFCMEHPEKIIYCDPAGVEFLLGELPENISFRPTREIPVLDLQTRKIYPSKTEAAKANHYSPSGLRTCSRFLPLESMPPRSAPNKIQPRRKIQANPVTHCPNCNSQHIYKNGNPGGRTRYVCQNCKKYFVPKITYTYI